MGLLMQLVEPLQIAGERLEHMLPGRVAEGLLNLGVRPMPRHAWHREQFDPGPVATSNHIAGTGSRNRQVIEFDG